MVSRGCWWPGRRRQAHREWFTASRARPCRLSTVRIGKPRARSVTAHSFSALVLHSAMQSSSVAKATNCRGFSCSRELERRDLSLVWGTRGSMLSLSGLRPRGTRDDRIW